MPALRILIGVMSTGTMLLAVVATATATAAETSAEEPKYGDRASLLGGVTIEAGIALGLPPSNPAMKRQTEKGGLIARKRSPRAVIPSGIPLAFRLRSGKWTRTWKHRGDKLEVEQLALSPGMDDGESRSLPPIEAEDLGLEMPQLRVVELQAQLRQGDEIPTFPDTTPPETEVTPPPATETTPPPGVEQTPDFPEEPQEEPLIPEELEVERDRPEVRVEPQLYPPDPTTDVPASVQDLRPSSNPLLYPTETDEVRIDEVIPLTLEQAIEVALSNNQDVREARLTLARSRELLREALALQFPTLSTTIDVSRNDSAGAALNARQAGVDPATDEIFDADVINTLDASLDLTYNVYTGGSRPAQIRLAEAQVRSDQLNLEAVSEQLRFDVTDTYYTVQEADSQVEIEEAAVADAAQSLRDAQLLEQAGLGTRFDVLQAEVELANAEQNLRLALSQQRISRRQLVEVLGLALGVEVTAAEPPEVAGEWELTLEQTIILALRNRAELQQQLLQIQIAEQNRIIALADLRPQLSLISSYNLLEEFGDDLNLEDGFTLIARLQWTLFDGGSARAQARQEEANIEIAQTNFDDQRNQVRFEVEQAFFNLQANRENITTAELAVEQAEESLRLARLRFQAGVGTQTDVINAQSALTEARGNLLTAIIDFNRSLAALQRAVSNLPDGRLFDLP